MKKLKKILTVVLTITMLIVPFSAVTTNASENENLSDENITVYDLTVKFLSAYGDVNEKNIIIDDEHIYNDYVVVYYKSSDYDFCVCNHIAIGDYLYETGYYYEPSVLGTLVVNPQTEDVEFLEDAIKSGIISDKEIFADNDLKVFRMYLFGDLNLDYSLDIRDATEIQKILTSLTSYKPLRSGFSTKLISDVDCDGEVTISDATTIQKKLTSLI
jgi:hypothetical protein